MKVILSVIACIAFLTSADAKEYLINDMFRMEVSDIYELSPGSAHMATGGDGCIRLSGDVVVFQQVGASNGFSRIVISSESSTEMMYPAHDQKIILDKGDIKFYKNLALTAVAPYIIKEGPYVDSRAVGANMTVRVTCDWDGPDGCSHMDIYNLFNRNQYASVVTSYTQSDVAKYAPAIQTAISTFEWVNPKKSLPDDFHESVAVVTQSILLFWGIFIPLLIMAVVRVVNRIRNRRSSYK